jgi:hypothetical protein
MIDYIHYHTSTEVLKQLDKIFDERKDAIKNGEVLDVKLFKQIFNVTSLFGRSKFTPSDILAVEDPCIEVKRHGMELFMTAYSLSGKLRMQGGKVRKGFRTEFSWYVIATSKLLNLEALISLMGELSDHRFARNTRIFMMDVDYYREEFKRLIRLNPHVNDEIKLWAELQ